jgi:hypothetical protein
MPGDTSILNSPLICDTSSHYFAPFESITVTVGIREAALPIFSITVPVILFFSTAGPDLLH